MATIDAAHDIRRHGMDMVVITLGQAGAVAVTAEAVWCAEAPLIEAANSVGSGDSFLGSLVTSLLQDLPPADALR